LPGEVVEVGPETVTVDFNHDLAGETLEFEIKVVDVS
jgi:FKBP-type peptidyl-prolyl cis-trans isomerase 2